MNYETIEQFYNLLFDHGEIIEFRLIHPDWTGNKKEVPSEFVKFNGDISGKITDIISRRNKDYNLYFGVMPRIKDGEKSQIARINTIFLDIDSKDFSSDEEFEKHIQRVENEILPAINLYYTVKISSGFGIHYYFILSKTEKLPIKNNKNCEEHREIEKALIKICYGDRDVKDLQRILRLPGSMNIKKQDDFRPCEILELHEKNIYNYSSFLHLLKKYREILKEEKSIKKSAQKFNEYTSIDSDRGSYVSIILQVLREYGTGLFSNYNDFLNFCLGCKHEGLPYEAIDGILQQSDNYDSAKNIKLYEKLKPQNKTFGTVYYYAEQANSNHLKQLLKEQARKNKAVKKHEISDLEYMKKCLDGEITEEIPKKDYTKLVLYTDTWNSERFVEQHKDNIRYCYLWKSWLTWTGQRWETDESGKIQEMAKETVRSFYSRAGEIADDMDRQIFVKHIRSSENSSKRKAMIELAQSEKGIPIQPGDLDQDRWLLNCNNGTLNLKTCELLPHNRKHLITKKIDVNYNPDASCPTWEKFLNTTFAGNTELINFVQKAIGYSLTGSTQEQCLFILYGTGANGKSTLLTTIKEILGEYSEQAYSETLMAKKNTGSVPCDLAMLRGARFVSCVETEEGGRFAEVLIKQLTGDDPITARFLFQNPFTFRPECKIWLASNHKPRVRGTDYAIWRRIRLIPFTVTIPEEERDPFLLEKLKEEKEGILTWIVEGCRQWIKEGLKAPDEVKMATDEYRNEMDTIGDFLNEICLIGSHYKALAGDLYKAYCKWCEDNGEKEISQRVFGMKLTERGYIKEKSFSSISRGKFFYTGIGIISEDAPVAPNAPLIPDKFVSIQNSSTYYSKQGVQGVQGVQDKNTLLYNKKLLQQSISQYPPNHNRIPVLLKELEDINIQLQQMNN